MHTEIEAKWLDIDKDEIRKKLKAIGAELIIPERLITRRVFDFEDKRLYKIGGWVRVRDEGDKITLSYKQLSDRSLHGTKEVTATVDNFDMTCNFLMEIGLKSKSYQETKRESWKYGEVEIEIDTWPWIPSFVEIESPSEERLRDTADKLGLNIKDELHGSVEVAYQALYNVTELEIDHWSEILFSDVPDWLSKRVIK